MRNYLIVFICLVLTACNSVPSNTELKTRYKILSENDVKTKYGDNCSTENKIEILDVYSETQSKYNETASNKAGRIAQNVIKFLPSEKNLTYSIRVNWNNENGKGVLNDKGKLSAKENSSGEIFWRFSLPGSYDLFWTLINDECEVNIETGFSVVKEI